MQPVRHTAARELGVSLSTLNRRIRDGDVEVLREGRRVYVRVAGPEYLSDEELLLRARARTDELEEAVRRWERIASELERERDEAKRDAAGWEEVYERLKELHLEGVCGARADGAMGRQVGSCRRRADRAAGRQRACGVAAAGVGRPADCSLVVTT